MMPEPLSPAEQKIADIIREGGASLAEVAKDLGVSDSTVRTHVCNIRKKGHELARNSRQRIAGQSTLYDGDGNQVLQWVKTKEEPVKAEDAYREIVSALREKIPASKPVACRAKGHTDSLLNVYILTDYHLGMKAWHEENRDEDWDTSIAEQLLVDWFSAAIAASPKAETAVLAQLGDFLHWDGMDAVTPASGHLLDADTRFQKIVRVAIRALRRIIKMLLEKYREVHLVMAEGNHDPASSVWLREIFSAFYDHDPRISVDDSPDPYYCYEHGATSLFFHHGHKKKVTGVDSGFVSKFREVFGRTRHSYAHMGHFHHIEVKETNLMVVEQHRTLASPDAYASRGAWTSGRDAKCITYHKDFGEIGRVSLTPQMVRAA